MKIATFSPISNGALKSEELPTSIKVLSFGKTETLDDPIYLNEKARKLFSATQKKIGRERVPIDFNHNTVKGSEAYEADKEPRAVAGYATPVLKEDGLWLEDIQWTPTGKDTAKDYEDLSPAPLLDDKNNVIGLHSVALCPAGAISDLHFYSATIKDMKKSTMRLSTEDKEVAEHLDKDIEEQEKGIEEDKKLKSKIKPQASDNDYQEQIKPQGAELEKDDSQIHGDDCKCSQCQKEIVEEAHEEHCMCATCTADMKKQIFTKLSVSAGPDGEIHKVKNFSAVAEPNAYLTEPENNKTLRTFMDEKIAKMATELNLPDASELEKRLKAWLAEWLGEDGVKSPITGDPKPAQFSAEVTELSNRIKTLEADRDAQIARFSAMEKDAIVSEATKNGKVVPFSADEIKELSPKTLKGIIDKMPVTVPLSAKTKVLSATGKPETKTTMADSARAIQEQVEAVLANS